MTCTNCSGAIEKHLGNSVEGIVEVKVSLMTHKATVKHDISKIRPRKIIEEIEDIGFGADLQQADDNIDIREIVRGEMLKYRAKVITAWLLYIPMAFFIWIMPYVEALKPFMKSYIVWNGCPLYVFLNFIFSGIIQFYMG